MDIFKLLDDKFNLSKKINNLCKLLTEKDYFYNGSYWLSFEDYLNRYYFRKWKYSYGCYSVEEFKQELGISYFTNGSGEAVFYPKDEIQAIQFLQYALNSTLFVNDCIQKDEGYLSDDVKEFYDIFGNQFKYIMDKIGQKIVKDPNEDYYIIVPNNNKTMRACEIQGKADITFLLYEYTSILIKNDVERKREILKLLATELEPVIAENLSKYNSGPIHDIFFNLSSCFNNFNIRHNNLDPRKKGYYHKALENFTPDDYKEIYDVTYDLILDAILIGEFTNKTQITYNYYKDKAGLKKTTI